jgi:hypothetical protein
MAKYEFFDADTNAGLGIFEGGTEAQAAEAFARGHGHASYAAYCALGPAARIVPLAPAVRRTPKRCVRCRQSEPDVMFTTGPGGACDDCF